MNCDASCKRAVPVRRKVLLGAVNAVVLIAGWSVSVGASANALRQPAKAPIVALGFDAPNHLLLKATATALYRSPDTGRHWTRIALPSNARGRIAAIATAAPQASGRIYVAGPGLGILRSDNDGRSWQARDAGLPSHAIKALAAHADQVDTVYVYVAGHGIFRSQKAGLGWRLMDRGPVEPILQLIHSNMPGSMQTGWLFAATPSGVRRSMDCFCGWRNAGGLRGRVGAVAYDPQKPQQIYAAIGKKLLLSTNGGEQWTDLAGPGPVLTALLVASDGALYAAGDGAVYRSQDHARTWERLDD